MKNTEIIKENRDFRVLFSKGKCIVTPFFVIYFRKNRLTHNRLGVTAGKKVGCAVRRNRAKRVLREAYRLCEDKLPSGYDYIAVARGAVLTKKTDELISPLLNALAKDTLKQSGQK